MPIDVIEFKRERLQEVLEQCTPKQQEFFGTIFPNGVPDRSLDSAYDLCMRTIRSNAKENSAEGGGECKTS